MVAYMLTLQAFLEFPGLKRQILCAFNQDIFHIFAVSPLKAWGQLQAAVLKLITSIKQLFSNAHICEEHI